MDDQIEWRSLASLGFPNYLASNKGWIKNIKTGYETSGSVTGPGYCRSSLVDYSGRSVKY